MSKSFKLFLLPSLIFFGVILSGLLLLKPQLEQISSSRVNLLQEKKTLADLTIKLAILSGLNVNELDAKTKVVLAALPTEKDVPRILLAIKNLAQNVGVALESIQLESGETSSKHNLSFLGFKIVVTGNMSQLKGFLDKIESVAPLMRVDTIEISQTKEGATETTLGIDSFFLSLPTSLGSTEKQILPVTAQEEKIYQKLSKMGLPSGSLPSVTSGKANPFSL